MNEITGQLLTDHSAASCRRNLATVRDALYVLSGKWKIPLIIALQAGPARFSDLQRHVEGITPRLLSKELKELEQNDFVIRRVYQDETTLIEYELTAYSTTLNGVILALQEWGAQHRRHIQSAS